MTAVSFDPRLPSVQADPFPTFQHLREHDPVHASEVLGGWVLTRYDDVKLAISDRRFSADRMRPFFDQLDPPTRQRYAPLAESITHWAVFQDPPQHTRLRGLMNKAFTPQAIDALAPRIRAIVDQLLAAADPERCDLIADFAFPLPASVILEMLGLAADDLDRIKHWSDELALFVGSSTSTLDKYARATHSVSELNAYFHAAIERHRQHPKDDLLTALIAAREQGDLLHDDELVATCVLLVFAGHETTTNLIGNGLLALLRHPREWNRLRNDPSLIPLAVEELLRFDGPAATAVRIVREPVTLHGRTLEPGDRVFALINSANRDPRQFHQPDQLDVGRSPNRHLAFGHGIHFCIGATLARLEAQLALAALLQNYPHLSLANDTPRWNDSLVLRGLTSLPVRLK